MSGTPQSRWCIAGDGAIGMALAYRLHHQSVPVTLLTRNHVEDHLTLTYEPFAGPTDSWTCDARSRPDGRPIDHLVISTKAHSVQEVVDTWADSLNQNANVYFLQNGIGFEPTGLPPTVRAMHVVNGGFTAYLAGPRHVVQSAMDPIWIGTENGDPEPRELEGELSMLRRSGFGVRWTRSIRFHRWRKTAINTIVNTQAVLYECENGGLLEHPQAIEDTKLMCEELGALFAAMSVECTAAQLHEATTSLLGATARNICSTLQDFQNGLTRHELDHITRPLLDQARELGIATPRCEAIHDEASRRFDETNQPTRGTPRP